MPFKINTKKTYTFVYETEEDGKLTATFSFPTIEDEQTMEISKKLKGVDLSKIKEGDTSSDRAIISTTLYTLRSSLVDFTGINDESTVTEENPEGVPIKLRDENGDIIEEVQKAVFDFIFRLEGMKEKIMVAYIGPKGKNLKTGVMQQ